jgi:hydrogenase maturation protease
MSQIPKTGKVLIAGVGNELRQDDAFGILALRTIEKQKQWPGTVKFQDVGIGGIHLVQELHEQYDVLILLDAVRWGGTPGDIYFRKAETADIDTLPKEEKRNFLADMHYTNPVRALMLAKALAILPDEVYILGCEISSDDFEIGMSREVQEAIPKAIARVNKWFEYRIENNHI